MQPTFIPWIGYFAMIDKVDEFVILDSVQFVKRSWQQRNRIKSSSGELMLSVPVFNKGKSDQLIGEVKINKQDVNFKKIIPTIKNNYSKAPFYKEYSDQFFSILEDTDDSLEALNMNIIYFAMNALKISKDKISFGHEMNLDTKKANLLADICVIKNADTYLSAPGSKEYIVESGIFEKKDIKVNYHNYNHPVYPQLYGEFLPYMGVIDLIFNSGPNSRDVMLQGLGESS